MASRLLRQACIGVALTASLVLGQPQSVAGQLSDAFAAHFGSSRTRELGNLKAASLGFTLLTQYDSRWKDNLGTIADFDQLATTVGYNYLTGGLQHSWLVNSPCTCTFVIGGSAIFGITSDRLTEGAQDGLHNYLRYPHVRRGNVDNGDWIAGVDVDASLWRSWYGSRISLDLFAYLVATAATHHGEQSAGLGFGINVWLFRIQGSAHKSLWVDQSVEPAAVAIRLKSDYWAGSGLITVDRARLGALRDVLPSVGAAVTRSSGLFPGESEVLLSVFLEFPGGANDTWRLEFVNDALNDKDRGPTGGLRVVYVAR